MCGWVVVWRGDEAVGSEGAGYEANEGVGRRVNGLRTGREGATAIDE